MYRLNSMLDIDSYGARQYFTGMLYTEGMKKNAIRDYKWFTATFFDENGKEFVTDFDELFYLVESGQVIGFSSGKSYNFVTPWSQEAVDASHYLDIVDTVLAIPVIKKFNLFGQFNDLMAENGLLHSDNCYFSPDLPSSALNIGEYSAYRAFKSLVSIHDVSPLALVFGDEDEAIEYSNIIDYILRNKDKIFWLEDKMFGVVRSTRVGTHEFYMTLFKFSDKFTKYLLLY